MDALHANRNSLKNNQQASIIYFTLTQQISGELPANFACALGKLQRSPILSIWCVPQWTTVTTARIVRYRDRPFPHRLGVGQTASQLISLLLSPYLYNSLVQVGDPNRFWKLLLNIHHHPLQTWVASYYHLFFKPPSSVHFICISTHSFPLVTN